MKKVLIILDGLMENIFEKISIKDILFNDNKVVTECEWIDFSVKGKEIDSLNCIMNMLGYSRDRYSIGERAYYEGLSRGIHLKEEQCILRCNVVKVNNGILEDFTGGDLLEGIELIINNISIEHGYFYPCFKYKNLLVLNEEVQGELYPPHTNVGKKIDDILPKDEKVLRIIKESYNFFKKNGKEGLMLWPWGKSGEVSLPLIKEYDAVVSGIDLIAGIGIALGMKSIIPKGCNGEYDTNLKEKLQASLELLEEYDKLIIHINGFDELSHRKDFIGKLDFIERFREEFLNPFLEGIDDYEEFKVHITSDHRTDSITGNHEEGQVPFIICSKKSRQL